MKKQTAHEKKVELAKASAPNYGVYIEGISIEKLKESILAAKDIIGMILGSSADEKTKRKALELAVDFVPKIENITISNVSIDQRLMRENE